MNCCPVGVIIEKEVENNDGVIRMLKYIRKGGMDIVFPQLLHDKVSMSGFDIFSWLKKPVVVLFFYL
jgi:hypothetical protein